MWLSHLILPLKYPWLKVEISKYKSVELLETKIFVVGEKWKEKVLIEKDSSLVVTICVLCESG